MSGGVEVGGPIAVDTEDMLRAAAVLGDARDGLAHLQQRTRAAAHGASPALAGQLHAAADLIADARSQADLAADGLRAAAHRYGWTEHAIARAQQAGAAGLAALEGSVVRMGGVGGLVEVAAFEAVANGAFVGVQVLDEWLRTGRVDPQSDPEIVRWLQLRLSSIDDALRGFLLLERPADLVSDDPGGFLGLETVGSAIAALVWPRPRGPVEVRPTTSRPARRPASITELAERLPDGAEPAGQVRIERYDDECGRTRWIVFSAGTVTFDVDSGDEPFDLESDVRGVAADRTDAQDAVLDAMRQAGIGPHDPVLMVGHSQGALNVMRIAEQGGYAVDGVVEFGGPTEQIPAPEGVAVLQVVHDQDLVPALGGVAAAAGAGTTVVRRSLPERDLRPGAATGKPIDRFPAHDMRNYRETVRRAEALDGTGLRALRTRWSGFFEGPDGRSDRYRARRVAPQTPAPVSAAAPSPTAGAAPAPPASR